MGFPHAGAPLPTTSIFAQIEVQRYVSNIQTAEPSDERAFSRFYKSNMRNRDRHFHEPSASVAGMSTRIVLANAGLFRALSHPGTHTPESGLENHNPREMGPLTSLDSWRNQPQHAMRGLVQQCYCHKKTTLQPLIYSPHAIKTTTEEQIARSKVVERDHKTDQWFQNPPLVKIS